MPLISPAHEVNDGLGPLVVTDQGHAMTVHPIRLDGDQRPASIDDGRQDDGQPDVVFVRQPVGHVHGVHAELSPSDNDTSGNCRLESDSGNGTIQGLTGRISNRSAAIVATGSVVGVMA